MIFSNSRTIGAAVFCKRMRIYAKKAGGSLYVLLILWENPEQMNFFVSFLVGFVYTVNYRNIPFETE